MAVIDGLIVLIGGMIFLVFSKQFARYRVAYATIGSTTDAEEAEPKGWMVAYMKLIGVVIMVAGAIMIYYEVCPGLSNFC